MMKRADVGQAAFKSDWTDFAVMKDMISEEMERDGDLPSVEMDSPGLVILNFVPLKWRKHFNTVVPNVRAIVTTDWQEPRVREVPANYQTIVRNLTRMPWGYVLEPEKVITIDKRLKRAITWVYDGETCRRMFAALGINQKYIVPVELVLAWPSGEVFGPRSKRRMIHYRVSRRIVNTAIEATNDSLVR